MKRQLHTGHPLTAHWITTQRIDPQSTRSAARLPLAGAAAHTTRTANRALLASQFVSDRSLVMFDPHTKHLPGATANQPGIKIRFVDTGERERAVRERAVVDPLRGHR